MSLNLTVLCLISILACGYSDNVDDPGFDLFFETNLAEMNDVPIEFEHPVPHWIRGTLVSLCYHMSHDLYCKVNVTL